MVETAWKAKEILEKQGENASVINARFIKPLDTDTLREIIKEHRMVVTLEEGVLMGGFGQAVSEWYSSNGYTISVRNIALPDKFIEHGSVDILKEKYGLSAEKVVEQINSWRQNERA